MRCARLARVFLCLCGCIVTHSTHGANRPQTVEPLEACVDFAGAHTPGLAWTLEDCLEVWTQFVHTVPRGQRGRSRFVDVWRDTASELRRAGTPCLAGSRPTPDGIGSSTIRLLASWIFAEEMGCDWVTPDWDKVHFDGGNGTLIMYCHAAGTRQEMAMHTPKSVLHEKQRCTAVDWLGYFQFEVPSVSLPETGKIKSIPITRKSAETVERETWALKSHDEHENKQPGRVLFEYHANFGSENLCCIENWDEPKRETTRKVLGEARKNFHAHLHPSPRSDVNSDCDYSATRLNFALHVRMGDRREYQRVTADYFALLELFMDTVSAEVVLQGLEPPLFHVFSETLVPCPSAETGQFDEFPTWPVKLTQVPECLQAKTPHDCPERRARRSCNPDRSGVFDVVGKPILLHVGHHVKEAMSCMIDADGLLMGCSAFGQIAGILTKGISFFSMHCSGDNTGPQYKTTPPLAVAERGHLWVPVGGSWRDPVLASVEPLRRALATHIGNRNAH